MQCLFPSSAAGLNALMHECILAQHVSLPTRYDSVLDLVFSRDIAQSSIDIKYLPPLGKSDHVCLDISVILHNSDPQTDNVKHRRLEYNFRRADWTGMCSTLGSYDWTSFFTCNDVDMCWSMFLTSVHEAMNKHVPRAVRSSRRKVLPWLAHQDLSFLKEKNRSWKTHMKTKSQRDLLRYKSLRNAAANRLRYLRVNYERRLAFDVCRNHKAFYSYANMLSSGKSCIHSMNDANGNHVEDPFNIAEILADYFSSVFGKPSSSYSFSNAGDLVHHTTDILSHITQYDIIERLAQLNIHKSAGPDGLPNLLLKETKLVIGSLLQH
jgi:hypothetical protein